MKFEFNWSSGFRAGMFENIDRRLEDGWMTEAGVILYTISPPMSLRADELILRTYVTIISLEKYIILEQVGEKSKVYISHFNVI